MNKLILITILILNLSLAGGQLWLTTQRATDGGQLLEIEKQTSQLKLENWRLEQELYAKSSLQYIYSQAQNVNLASIKAQFAAGPLPVAKTNSMP